jgi:hypothetical protein
LADFYTNISVSGRYILYRGVENDKRVRRKIEFRPTFYLIANEKTEYKTLSGEFVKSIEPGTIPECREFLKVSIISLFLVIIVMSMLLLPIVILMIFFGILTKLLSLISTLRLDPKTDSLSQEMPTNQSPPSLLNSRVIILCLAVGIISSTVTMCTMQSAEMNSTLYEDSSTSGQDSTQMWSQDGTSSSSTSPIL